MKTNYVSFLIAGGFLALNLSAFAQKDSSGIYLTAEDFKNQKLTYAINYKTEAHKISTFLLFDGNHVKVKHHDTTYTLDKDSTYGYKSTNGETFRFVDGIEYKVLNPMEEILIYEHSDWLDPIRSPLKRSEDHYYFSKDVSSTPVHLNVENLKKAYRQNSKFLASLDKYFKTDDELTSYDEKRKTYTLNWLLQQSLK